MGRPKNSKNKHSHYDGIFRAGQKFNDWTLLDSKTRGHYLFVECKCGLRKEILASNLVKGESKRCRKCAMKRVSERKYKPSGCKYDNVYPAGYKFGAWEVVDSRIRSPKMKQKLLLVQCECGAKKEKSIYHLSKGRSIQCKNCMNLKDKSGMWKGIGEVPGTYLNQRRKNLSKELKQFVAELYEKQERKCSLTGLPINFEDKSASLDRIDSTKPYSVDNVQWIHKDVNYMKGAYSQNYFLTMCHLITKNNKNPNDMNPSFVMGRDSHKDINK